MHDKSSVDQHAWYCALDRQMKQVYIGRDSEEARRLGLEGYFMASAKRMGDAITAAASAAAASLKPPKRSDN